MTILEVVVFSGGRGTRAIQSAFPGIKALRVTYLINGYDSGLSTGEVRRLIPGMLGPSDFRKALSGLSQSYEMPFANDLARLLEFRLPERAETAEAMFHQWLYAPSALEFIRRIVPSLPLGKALEVSGEMVRFSNYAKSHPEKNFNCSDLAVGNAYFGGLFLREGSFNAALEIAKELFEFPSNVDVLNITGGDDLWASVSTAEASLCVEEGHFVSFPPPSPIDEVFLLDRNDFHHYRERFSLWARIGKQELLELKTRSVAPSANQVALQRIAAANTIIYGSGTLHSSLLPSYLTKGVSKAIRGNTKAMKILFVNGSRDTDIHKSVSRDVTLDFYRRYLGLPVESELASIMTEVWISGGPWVVGPADGLSEETFAAGIPIRQLTDGRQQSYTDLDSYGALSHAMSRHIGVSLGSKSNLTSVVIPMLNERNRLEALKADLGSLVNTDSGNLIEVIVADGQSSDGSRETVQGWSDIRLIDVEESGRGSAVASALSVTRGQTVGVFHADCEYSPKDLQRLLSLAERNPDTIYIASRSHGAGGAQALRRVYAGRRLEYWLSRIGGVAVSTILNLRLGRSLSDPFSGIFACNRELAMRYFSVKGDTDSFIRGIMAAHRDSVPLVEIGVSYRPRGVSEGKKTGVKSGVRALVATFR